jgi:hypothetical protein
MPELCGRCGSQLIEINQLGLAPLAREHEQPPHTHGKFHG